MWNLNCNCFFAKEVGKRNNTDWCLYIGGLENLTHREIGLLLLANLSTHGPSCFNPQVHCSIKTPSHETLFLVLSIQIHTFAGSHNTIYNANHDHVGYQLDNELLNLYINEIEMVGSWFNHQFQPSILKDGCTLFLNGGSSKKAACQDTCIKCEEPTQHCKFPPVFLGDK